jgi:hypothetical protein
LDGIININIFTVWFGLLAFRKSMRKPIFKTTMLIISFRENEKERFDEL